MTRTGRWVGLAFAAWVSQASCAEALVELRCLKGDAAALSDYRLIIGAEDKLMTPAEQVAFIRRAQRGVDNECTQATRVLAYARLMELSGIAPGTEQARRDALDAEILALATEGARVDCAWYFLGLYRLTHDSRFFDRAEAVKAFETGASHGDKACLDYLVEAYAEGRDGITPDPAKEAFWRDRRDATKK